MDSWVRSMECRYSRQTEIFLKGKRTNEASHTCLGTREKEPSHIMRQQEKGQRERHFAQQGKPLLDLGISYLVLQDRKGHFF